MENATPVKKPVLTIGQYIIIAVVIFIIAKACDTTPSACDCYDILNVPSERLINDNGERYGMPFATGNQSNEEYKKYKKCQDAYAGPSGALLKCN